PAKQFSRSCKTVLRSCETSVQADARGPLAGQALSEVTGGTIEGDPLVRHGVALAHRDGVVVQGVEVDRDRKWGADFVVAAVAAPNRARVIEVDVPRAAQVGGEVLGDRRELLVARQREYRRLHGCEARIEP